MVYLVCFLAAALGVSGAIVGGVAAVGFRRQAILLILAPTVLFVSLSSSHLPLRLAFQWYQDDFEAIARNLQEGRSPETPFRVGPFLVTEVGRRSGDSIPYFDVRGQRQEVEGFVRHPLGDGFNLWSCISLTENWSYIAED